MGATEGFPLRELRIPQQWPQIVQFEGLWADPPYMKKLTGESSDLKQLELELPDFEQLDELIDVFVRTVRKPSAQADLRYLMEEAELIVECINRMDEWIQRLESSEAEGELPDPLRRERLEQIKALYTGCAELIEVATEIIPGQVATLVMPHLH